MCSCCFLAFNAFELLNYFSAHSVSSLMDFLSSHGVNGCQAVFIFSVTKLFTPPCPPTTSTIVCFALCNQAIVHPDESQCSHSPARLRPCSFSLASLFLFDPLSRIFYSLLSLSDHNGGFINVQQHASTDVKGHMSVSTAAGDRCVRLSAEMV